MPTASVRTLSGEPVGGAPVTLGHVAELLSGLLFFLFLFYFKYLVCISN